MPGIFFESLPLGGSALVAIALGFLLGLYRKIQRPARTGMIVAGAAFGVVLCCFFVFPWIGYQLVGSCREPPGRVALDVNLAIVMLAAPLVAVGAGILLASVWRANRRILALVLAAILGPAMVVFVYIAIFGVGFSAEGCFH